MTSGANGPEDGPLTGVRRRLVPSLWALAQHVPGGVAAWEWGLRRLGRFPPPAPAPEPEPTPPPEPEPTLVTASGVVVRPTVPLPDQPSRWCKLCDLPDWESEAFLALLDDLSLDFGRRQPHRKHWEFAHALHGLRHFGYLTPDTLALGIGAGREFPIYYLANHVRKVIATDIYGEGDFETSDALADMLVYPEKHAPFPYRECHLVTQYMDGCHLRYPSSCFDVVFSFSSIEHFGGHDAAAQAMREIGRVLRPGGMAVIATEAVLNGVAHAEFFLPDELYTYLVEPSGLRLVEPIDLTITPSLLQAPQDVRAGGEDRFPHIVCQVDDVVFTSVLLFLQKPAAAAEPPAQPPPTP